MAEHRGAFEYDWRTRFGIPLSSLDKSDDWADWSEAYRLMVELCLDPSSHVAAAIAGWQSPATDASLVLADLFDLQARSKTKRKPASYPRPWDAPAVRHGNRMVTVEEWNRMKEARHG